MRADLRKRRWSREFAVQRAIMALALSSYPHWHTFAELEREIGDEEKAREAICELIRLGLLETHERSIRPTEAAAHMERLELP